LSKKAGERKCIVAVQVRGTVSAQREARATLDLLNLGRTNRAVLIDNRPAFIGMLRQVQAYVTWGEASPETVAALLQKRGRLAGGKKLTDAYAERVGYKSLSDLAKAIASCRAEYWKLPDVQPVFKLPPPTKGFKGKTKKSFRAGGEAGYRGEAINEIVKRMT
jgi:large subunit ribosomal protein L30